MNGMRLNRSGLNMSRLNASLLNASGIGAMGCKGKVTMEDRIMESMVLWYDIGKQGATNEGMAADPRIIDHSGNGHHATCYNFTWSGMSGIGGYADSYIEPHWYIENKRVTATKTEAKINVTGILSSTISIYYQSNAYEQARLVPSYRIKVIGLTDGQSITYRDTDNTVTFMISNDGEYTLPEINFAAAGKFYGFAFNKLQDSCNITIEQLPLYPNALVSDGVDDYCLVEGLPLLNKEDGYTVIAKRKWLTEDLTVESLKDKCFLSDMPDGGAPYGGAYAIELNLSNGCNAQSCGSRTVVNISEDDIVYQTSTSYCGQNIETSSAFVEGNGLFKLFKFGTSYWSPIALNSILLFNRDLSTDEIEWVKNNLIEGNDDDAEWYGVEFYTTDPNPDCIRIGNPELHKTLPIHSQMKGCLLNDDGEVIKYLNTSDWTSETRDGSQGQVMVEIPEHYVKFETDGTKRRVKMSITPIVGYKKIEKYYISAYEATVQRSTNKLCSVVNTDEDYRGGNNNSANDAQSSTFLGTAATAISRTNFRTYARNRKEGSTEWNCMTYDAQKDLYWLFVVEYATLNSQKAFNAAKTAEGYAQGGLGNGVTSLNGTKWNTFNGYYPVIPCGHTDSLGNGTGEVDYQMPEEYDTNVLTVKVPRYRGIENPFGHLWQWTDGINVRISPNEPDGDGLSKVYVCSDPSKFNDTNYDGYTYVGDEVRTQAYVKEVIFGEGGEIMPSVAGGSPTTYFCDYHYTNIPAAETLCGVLFGGAADYSVFAGFVSADSSNVSSRVSARIGSRLCFIPNNND